MKKEDSEAIKLLKDCVSDDKEIAMKAQMELAQILAEPLRPTFLPPDNLKTFWNNSYSKG